LHQIPSLSGAAVLLTESRLHRTLTLIHPVFTREAFRSFGQGEEYLTSTDQIPLEKNYFSKSHGVGVYIDAYVSGVTIQRNLIAEAGSTGIYLETGSHRNTIEQNFVINNGFRESGPGGQLATLNGFDFWFWGVGREGLAIDGSYENTARRNIFAGNSAGGLFLYKNCGEFPESHRPHPISLCPR
jgi:parallel beta helix pectate lyase-like protein